MSLRFDDDQRQLTLSVGDLVSEGARDGHLTGALAARSAARLRWGQQAHADWAAEQAAADPTFQAEVSVRRQVVVDGWTVVVQGRLDGEREEAGHRVVEEVKSTVLPAERLLETTLAEWPDYARQLQLYLWIRAAPRGLQPVGRLVLLSLLDGSRHVLGLAHDAATVDASVRRLIARLVRERERRQAWLASRRHGEVPLPYSAWRAGQEDIAAQTLAALREGRPMLVQAPTGLGKTGPVLWAALRFAREHDLQVFWATARTTHQAVAAKAVGHLREAGLSVRALTLAARDKACLNEVVACSPDRCPFAERYFARLYDSEAREALWASDEVGPIAAREVGEEHCLCPVELTLDASDEVDLVIGDINYAFAPGVRLSRHFEGDAGRGWVVVADEAHQLVERARDWGSPRVGREQVQAAREAIAALDHSEPLLDLLSAVDEQLEQALELPVSRFRDGVRVVELSANDWAALATGFDEVALEHARLVAERVAREGGVATWPDPWHELARRVARLAEVLTDPGDHLRGLVGERPETWVGVLCLDPAVLLRDAIAGLAGFVGCSATLSPPDYYQTVLGLPERTGWIDVDGVFPAENRLVLAAPRVSTAYRDRVAHAPATAILVSRCIAATPGNVAVYAPSFQMLDDLCARLELPSGVELLVQQSGSTDRARAEVLARLEQPGRVVLAGVLGGVFAEGVDLPPGSLDTVLVIGPGLPPVGLERDLLRERYDSLYGDGFRFASLVPGLTRVVQAAGRLHRRPEDRGVIVLVGRRFRWRDVRALLPTSWDAQPADEPWERITTFFAEHAPADAESEDAG